MHHDTAFAVKAGQVLRFDFPKDGARTYLAVAGGIDVRWCWAAVRPTRWAHSAVFRGAGWRLMTCCR
ncbi:hypothetical protein CFN58_14960, partial [Pseudomonas avellanae]